MEAESAGAEASGGPPPSASAAGPGGKASGGRKGRRWSLDTINPMAFLRRQLSTDSLPVPLTSRMSVPNFASIAEERMAPVSTSSRRGSRNSSSEVFAVLDLEDGATPIVLTAQDENQLKVLLWEARMEYRVSSYRLVVASTRSNFLRIDSSPSPTLSKSCENIFQQFQFGILAENLNDPRYKLVSDLLTSETEYSDNLKLILDYYAEPLRKFSSLSTEDHRILFMGIQPVLSMSSLLITRLEVVLQSWDPGSSKIGNFFNNKFWNTYSDYYDCYSAIKSLLASKAKADETFMQFCQLQRNNGKPSLEGLLMLPVQRLPEYDAFLSGLLEEVATSHPDYDDLSKAARRVQSMVREREDELREAENDARMEAVQDRFPNDDLNLRAQKSKSLPARRKSAPSAVIFRSLGSTKSKHNPALWSQCNTMGRRDGEPQRSYIMEGPAQFSAGMQTQDRYLFLFSDLLLVAKQKSATQYKLKNRVPVSDLWLATCVEDVSEASRTLEKSFVMGWPTTNVVATFKDSETKDLWHKKLTERIEAEKSREEHKTVSMKVVTRDIGVRTNEQPFPSCEVQITSKTEARDVLKVCLEQLQISEAEARDYQLWVRGGKEGTPYPLIGHELPFAIKASYVRELKAGEDFVSEQALDATPANMKCEFILKFKKSQKKQSFDEALGKRGRDRGREKKKGATQILNLFRRGKNEEKSSGGNSAPPGKLFGHPLPQVFQEGDLPPKPILDLLGIIFREGPYTMGIFRKSANARMCREVRGRLDEGEELELEDKDTVLAGALLKEYLRAIPRGLLLEDHYEEWMATVDLPLDERLTRTKKLLNELPTSHLCLLRYVLCALHQIQQHEDINKMGALNLSLCIAPSLLWPKGESVEPMVGPVIQFLLENCADLLGGEVTTLLGEPVEHKGRQDSGTDSDSMHSVLSMPDTSNGLRRDDSSMDSLVDRDLYTGENDHSPQLVKSHLSPSNLSRDSGLTLSDTQLYDDEASVSGALDGSGVGGVGMLAKYARSASHYLERDLDRGDQDIYSKSMGPLHHQQQHSLSQPQHIHFLGGDAGSQPVPPPRKSRRRCVEVQSPLDAFRSYSSDSSGARTDRLSRSLNIDQLRQTHSHPPFGARVSGDSLHSVEESLEDEAELRRLRRPTDIGLLVKSASGGHLILNEEGPGRGDAQARLMRERFVRQASLTSTPPLSPQYTSCSSSRDSVLSQTSMLSESLSSYYQDYCRSSTTSASQSAPQTPDDYEDKPPPWLPDPEARERSMSDVNNRLHASLNLATEKPQGPSRLTASYGGGVRSLQNMHYLVSPPSSPTAERKQFLTRRPERRSLPVQLDQEATRGEESASTGNESEETVVPGSSPKISITYCSSSSEERLEEKPSSESEAATSAPASPSSKSQPMDMPHSREISLLSKGIVQGSPPPRVLLTGLRQAPRKESAPMRASHDCELLLQVQRGGADSKDASPTEPTPRPITEAQSSESSHRPRFSLYQQPSPPPYTGSRRLAKSMMDLSGMEMTLASPRSLQADPARPNKPPAYQVAVQRQHMIKAGIPLDLSDQETVKQKEASRRAKELYEESLQRYMQDRYDQRHYKSKSTMDVSSFAQDFASSPPSDAGTSLNDVTFSVSVTDTTDSVAASDVTTEAAAEAARARREVGKAVSRAHSEERGRFQRRGEEEVGEEDVYVTLRRDPKKVYEESIKRYQQEAEHPKSAPGFSGSPARSQQRRESSPASPGAGRGFRLESSLRAFATLTAPLSPRKSSDPSRLAVPTSGSLHRSLSDSAEHLNKLGPWSPRSPRLGAVEGSRTRGGTEPCQGQGQSLPLSRERSDSSPIRQPPSTHSPYFYHPAEETRRSPLHGGASSPLQSAPAAVAPSPQRAAGSDSVADAVSDRLAPRAAVSASRPGDRDGSVGAVATDSRSGSSRADRSNASSSQERGLYRDSEGKTRDGLSRSLDLSVDSRVREGVPDRTLEIRQTERSSVQTVERQRGTDRSEERGRERRVNLSSSLPWSVANLKQLYDPRRPRGEATESSGDLAASSNADSASSPSSRGAPPPYVPPPPFKRLQDQTRVSISSNSSVGSSGSGAAGDRSSPASSASSARRGTGRLGPQCAVDWHSSSFSSSSEDLHDTHRYGGRARSESGGGVSDPESLSFADVSYV